MILETVKHNILQLHNISINNINNLLFLMTKRKLDYADLYFQSNINETWLLEDKIIKAGYYNIDQGVGIRSVYKERTGFSYVDDINLNKLTKSVISVRNIVTEQNTPKNINLLNKSTEKKLYTHTNFLKNKNNEDKINLLKIIDLTVRSIDSRITKVTIRLSGHYEQILVAATDNTLAADIRPLVKLSIKVLAENNVSREIGISGGGGRYSYDYFFEKYQGEMRAIHYAKEAARMALTKLSAIDPPAGMMTVVLSPGWPGILLHEAVGHGLEGDFIRRNASIFNNKIGQKVASEICTIVDDSTFIGKRGSLSIDDEGVPGQYNILIKEGILQQYMLDKMNAKLMGTISTGNARRESYAHLPMPRMTNTYMLSGNTDPKSIISSVDQGIYATNFEGGQVDITSGNFVFSTSEAYLIKNGKISYPIKNTTLIGSGIEIMKKISMVGNDLKIDEGIGSCGKEGQMIPVSVGQPTLKIDNITVGGKL